MEGGNEFSDNVIAQIDVTSSTGLDGKDITNPPPSPAPSMDLYFLIGAGPYFTDSRPLLDPSPNIWALRAAPKYELEPFTKTVTITWNIASVPPQYVLTLTDLDGGTTTNMRVSPYYAYSHQNEDEFGYIDVVRRFTLRALLNNPPTVKVAYPNGGETVGGVVTVTALASDTDAGDHVASLSFQYSADGGATWNILSPGALTSGTNASGTWSASWNTSGLPEGSNYRIRALAADTFGLIAQDQSDAAFSIQAILWTIELSGLLSTSLSRSLPGAKALYQDAIIAAAAPWASAGEDGLDIPEPPPLPTTTYFDMYFPLGAANYIRDARPHANPTTWNFKARAEGLAGNTTITASYTGVPPSESGFIVLQDTAAGVSQNLKITPAYTYNASPGEIRNFNLFVKSNNPPSVQVTYPGAATAAGTINVTALASDPDGMAPYNDRIATLAFQYASAPYTTWYNIGLGFLSSGTPSSGTWSASWQTLLVPQGSGYKVGATAKDTLEAAAAGESPAFSIVHKIFATATFSAGWNMYSFPFQPDPDTMSGQLGDNISPLFAFHYFPPYNLTNVATAGWGYWTRVTASTPVDTEGIPITAAQFEIPLASGWNQIGHPYNSPANWGVAKVRYASTIYSILDAHLAGIVNQWLYAYIAGGYVAYTTDTGVLTPELGYWFRANQLGVTLIIPSP